MIHFVSDVRNSYGDLLRNQAIKLRRRTWISRERELRKYQTPPEIAVIHLRMSHFWKSGDLTLAWADLLDSLARTISGQPDHPATPLLRHMLDQQAGT